MSLKVEQFDHQSSGLPGDHRAATAIAETQEKKRARLLSPALGGFAIRAVHLDELKQITLTGQLPEGEAYLFDGSLNAYRHTCARHPIDEHGNQLRWSKTYENEKTRWEQTIDDQTRWSHGSLNIRAYNVLMDLVAEARCSILAESQCASTGAVLVKLQQRLKSGACERRFKRHEGPYGVTQMKHDSLRIVDFALRSADSWLLKRDGAVLALSALLPADKRAAYCTLLDQRIERRERFSPTVTQGDVEKVLPDLSQEQKQELIRIGTDYYCAQSQVSAFGEDRIALVTSFLRSEKPEIFDLREVIRTIALAPIFPQPEYRQYQAAIIFAPESVDIRHAQCWGYLRDRSKSEGANLLGTFPLIPEKTLRKEMEAIAQTNSSWAHPVIQI